MLKEIYKDISTNCLEFEECLDTQQSESNTIHLDVRETGSLFIKSSSVPRKYIDETNFFL